MGTVIEDLYGSDEYVEITNPEEEAQTPFKINDTSDNKKKIQ